VRATHGYTPGLRVTERALIRRMRRLPLPGRIHVQVGDAVTAEQLVASTELPGNVANVNVAHELSATPEDTIETISEITGQVLVRGEPISVEIDAYIDGTVVDVEGTETVVIETRGALAQGILGVGGEAHGAIKVLCSGPDELCHVGLIAEECADCVLVGGGRVTLDALHAAVDARAAAVVTGAIDDVDLDDFLGYALGVAITGQEDLGTSLVLTEGFGDTPMRRSTFELLAARDGRRASVNGATQIRAGVIRPEVIVPEPGATWDADAEAAAAGLGVGSDVRLIRQPWFGRLAEVVELPERLETIPTEAEVRVARVRLEDTGEVVTVPRANLEIIEQ